MERYRLELRRELRGAIVRQHADTAGMHRLF
jgi:hypothetical protein